jgi:hypothetical protein
VALGVLYADSGKKADLADSADKAKLNELHAKIGELIMEREFFFGKGLGNEPGRPPSFTQATEDWLAMVCRSHLQIPTSIDKGRFNFLCMSKD